MAVTHSTTLRNNLLSGGLPLTGTPASFNAGKFRVLTGAAPANADAAETGTALTNITMSGPPSSQPAFSDPVAGGTAWFNPGIYSVIATGTAGYWRLVGSGDTGALNQANARLQGGVATSGAEMTVNTTSFVSGGQLSITTLSYTHGA